MQKLAQTIPALSNFRSITCGQRPFFSRTLVTRYRADRKEITKDFHDKIPPVYKESFADRGIIPDFAE